MNEPVNLAVRIVLYVVGILLVMMAGLILLKGVGLLPTIPEYVVWALVLLAIGIGIIGGLRSSRK
ncbi:MAG: hypothetical protein IGS48_14090 [Oscillatoriales cyanobacterium C42_A2020_001]|nr:hypothetical protein [Leptolyngbyaceae cyanobacterium C42_A2020_001]